MATNAQRVQWYGDAMVPNPPATQAQINRLGQGFAAAEGREAEYNAMSPGAKADYFMRFAVRLNRTFVSKRDQSVAYDTHVAPVDAAVLAEFPDG